MHTLNLLPMIAATALLTAALPALAQDATPGEMLPPMTSEVLPPGGEAPVDEVPPISDVAPDGGAPDATATRMACTFTTQCIEGECKDSGYAGKLTVMSDGAGMAEADWEDDHGPMAFSADLTDGVVRAYSTENSSQDSSELLQHILTIDSKGGAVFTTHKSAPASAISFAGSCEVAQ